MKIEDYNFYVRIPYFILNFVYNFVFIIYNLLLQRDFVREVDLNENVIPNDYNFYDKFFIFGEIDKKGFYFSCDNVGYKLIFDNKEYTDDKINITKKMLKVEVDNKINLYNLKDKEILEIKFDKEIISLIFNGYSNKKFYKFREGYIQTKKLLLENGIYFINNELKEVSECDLIFFKIQGEIRDENNLIELVD